LVQARKNKKGGRDKNSRDQRSFKKNGIEESIGPSLRGSKTPHGVGHERRIQGTGGVMFHEWIWKGGGEKTANGVIGVGPAY